MNQEAYPRNAEIIISEVEGVLQAIFTTARLTDDRLIKTLQAKIYDAVARQQRPKLIVNFEQVTYLTSSMLGAMVGVKKKIEESRGRLKLCGLRKSLFDIFSITGLDRIFEIYPGMDEAIAAFKNEKISGWG